MICLKYLVSEFDPTKEPKSFRVGSLVLGKDNKIYLDF